MTRTEFEQMIAEKDTSGLISGIKEMMNEHLDDVVEGYTKVVIEESGFKPISENFGNYQEGDDYETPLDVHGNPIENGKYNMIETQRGKKIKTVVDVYSVSRTSIRYIDKRPELYKKEQIIDKGYNAKWSATLNKLKVQFEPI